VYETALHTTTAVKEKKASSIATEELDVGLRRLSKCFLQVLVSPSNLDFFFYPRPAKQARNTQQPKYFK
jgi:hypothetical protein